MSTSWLLVILVVIWLFVLAPLVVNKRKPIRKTSAALSETRVLHRGGEEISATKRRPSFSASDVHETDEVDESLETVSAQFDDDFDPDEVLYDDTKPAAPEVVDGDIVYELESGEVNGDAEDADAKAEASGDGVDATPAKFAAVADADSSEIETAADQESVLADSSDDAELTIAAQRSEYLDVDELNYEAVQESEDEAKAEAADAEDVVKQEDPAADTDADAVDEAAEETAAEAADTETSSATASAEDELDDSLSEDDIAFAQRRRGRGGFDPEADAHYAQTRFARRRRSVAGLAAAVVITLILAVIIGGWAWVLPVLAVALMALYLVNLRKTVREEAELRARRIRRMKMARLGVRHQDDDALGIPQRLRRPGAVVLELDDEDPDFHDLPYAEIPPVTEDYRRAAV